MSKAPPYKDDVKRILRDGGRKLCDEAADKHRGGQYGLEQKDAQKWVEWWKAVHALISEYEIRLVKK